jgi:hypothetical protein
MRTRSLDYTIACKECETLFDTSVQDAKFCSASCRAKSHRRDKQAEKKIQKARNAVGELKTMWQYYDQQKVFVVLNEMIGELQKWRNAIESD